MSSSNKFTWGKYKRVPAIQHPGCDQWLWVSDEEEPLTVVSLSLTCRQFYDELKAYPVFYRVNEFHLDDFTLLAYLSAITPERRAMIRSVSVFAGDRVPGFMYVAYNERDQFEPLKKESKILRGITWHKHEVAMLAQCRDLRNFTISLNIGADGNGWASPSERAQSLDVLRECHTLAQAARGKLSVWGMQSLNIGLILGNKGLTPYGDSATIKLRNPAGFPTWREWGHFPEFTKADHDLRDAFESCRAVGMQPLHESFLTRTVGRAVKSAYLHMKGEDRLCGLVGKNRRTAKQRVLDESMNFALGIRDDSLRLLSRYDQDGRLLWPADQIRSVRQGPEGIECQVVWQTPGENWQVSGEDGSGAWEKAATLCTRRGLELFRQYYEDLNSKHYNPRPVDEKTLEVWESQMAHLNSVPLPNDIKELMEELFTNQTMQAKWRALQSGLKRRRIEYQQRVSAARKRQKALERVERKEQKRKDRKRKAVNDDDDDDERKTSKKPRHGV